MRDYEDPELSGSDDSDYENSNDEEYISYLPIETSAKYMINEIINKEFEITVINDKKMENAPSEDPDYLDSESSNSENCDYKNSTGYEIPVLDSASEDSDSENSDSENSDSENSDSENSDSENSDSGNSDYENSTGSEVPQNTIPILPEAQKSPVKNTPCSYDYGKFPQSYPPFRPENAAPDTFHRVPKWGNHQTLLFLILIAILFDSKNFGNMFFNFELAV